MKKKIIFSLLFLFVAVLLLVGCKNSGNENNESTDDYTKPALSNPETVEFTKDELNVSKGEIYNSMKAGNLIATVVNEIDKNLLTTELSTITGTDFYTLAQNYVYYGDANVSEDEKAELVDTFNESKNNLYLNGFRTDEQIDEYIKLEAAKMAKVYSYVLKAQEDSKSSYYLSEETLKNYYDNNKYQGTSAKAIVVNYLSENDFLHALESLGDYTIYNSKLVSKKDATKSNRTLTDEDVDVLTDDQAKTLFNRLWNENYSNGFDNTLTAEVTYNYDKLARTSSSFAKKLFALETNKYTYFVTSYSYPISTLYTAFFMVEAPVVQEYDKDAATNAYIMNSIKDASFVNTVMAAIRKEAQIEFTDRTLGYNYYNSYDKSYAYLDTKGDATIAVKTKDKSLTVDEIYALAKTQNFESYLLYASLPYLLSNTPSYANIFGSEKDMDKNASLRKAYYANTVNSDVETNYKSETYKTVSQYLYQKYGHETVEDVVKYVYMVGELLNFFVIDELYTVNTTDWTFTLNNEYEAKFQALIDDYYDNYYNIKAYNLVVKFDADNDLKTDDASTLQATQTEVLEHLYDYVKARVDKAINENEDKTSENTLIANEMNKIVKEYKNAKRSSTALAYSNDNALAYFKQYGLVLSYAQINSGNAATYINQGLSYTDEMNAALKELFNNPNMPTSSQTDKILVSDQMVYDKDGAHFIFATYGGSKLSFKSTSTSTYAYDADYKNEDEKMTVKQLAAAFYTNVYTTKYTSSTAAKDSYRIEFSDNKPSLTFTQYVKAVNDYYTSEYFYLQLVCEKIATTENQTVLTEFKTIFNKELGNLVD